MAAIDPRAYDETGVEERTDRGGATREDIGRRFPQHAPATDPQFPGIEDNADEATRLSSIDSIAAMERVRNAPHNNSDERTRAVNIRNDPSISDIDWDID